MPLFSETHAGRSPEDPPVVAKPGPASRPAGPDFSLPACLLLTGFKAVRESSGNRAAKCAGYPSYPLMPYGGYTVPYLRQI